MSKKITLGSTQFILTQPKDESDLTDFPFDTAVLTLVSSSNETVSVPALDVFRWVGEQVKTFEREKFLQEQRERTLGTLLGAEGMFSEDYEDDEDDEDLDGDDLDDDGEEGDEGEDPDESSDGGPTRADWLPEDDKSRH